MKNILYLDMDGVLTNFVDGACKALDTEMPKQWPKGEGDICKALKASNPKFSNLKIEDFWAKIDSFGIDFWTELKPYPWARELYEILNKEFDLYFCTTPSRNPLSTHGFILKIFYNRNWEHLKLIFLANYNGFQNDNI